MHQWMTVQDIRHQQQMIGMGTNMQQQMRAELHQQDVRLRAEMRAEMQQQMIHMRTNMQQQMRAELQQQDVRLRADMRAEMQQQMQEQRTKMQQQMVDICSKMRAYSAELRQEIEQLREDGFTALSHFRGMRKIASTQVTGIYCSLCNDHEVPGYYCQSCSYPVCIRCFPMAFHQRVQVQSVDSSIDYRCPFCNMTFANFPELSIDVEQQEQIIGSEEKTDDEEAVEEESELYEQSLMLSEDPLQLFYNN
jgi:hypothetical protein